MLQFFRSPSGPYPERRGHSADVEYTLPELEMVFVTQIVKGFKDRSLQAQILQKWFRIQPCSTCASKLMAASLHNSS